MSYIEMIIRLEIISIEIKEIIQVIEIIIGYNNSIHT